MTKTECKPGISCISLIEYDTEDGLDGITRFVGCLNKEEPDRTVQTLDGSNVPWYSACKYPDMSEGTTLVGWVVTEEGCLIEVHEIPGCGFPIINPISR